VSRGRGTRRVSVEETAENKGVVRAFRAAHGLQRVLDMKTSSATRSLVAAAMAGITLMATSPAAFAQDSAGAAPPPRVLYTAPLYQQTQGSYVPQSVAMSGPKQITDWKEGEPVPDGYHPVEKTRTGLIVGGSVLFGTMYFFSVLVAAGGADANRGGTNPEAAMWAPAIGPFIQMAQPDSSATANVLLAVDGLAQSAGLIMLIAGLTSPKTVLMRNDLAKEDTKPMLKATPIVGRGMTGVGVVGTF
jgi:hypothetical protein